MRIVTADDGAISLHGMEDWMDERRLGDGPLAEIRAIGGGTQNQVVRFRRGDTEYVLRAGPRRPRPSSTEAIRREARVVGALGRTEIRVPALVAADDDLGGERPFYLMRPVAGVLLPESLDHFDAHPTAKRRAGLAMVEWLAELAAIDHSALGLHDFGRPDGFRERQVARWSGQLAGYAQTGTYDGPGIDLEPLEEWLVAHVPPHGPVGILHGDFHLNNVLLRSDGEVAAVVDWELATIGDPLLDLGHLLVTWPSGDDSSIGMVPADRADGLATPAELVARYEERTGQQVDHLAWYAALAGYRMGVILEGTRARALDGRASPEMGELLHGVALVLWRGALARIGHPNQQGSTKEVHHVG